MNAKNSLSWLIPASLFTAAILVILDQTLKHGVIWDWKQVLHHENFALALVSVAIGVLLSKKIQSKNKKDKNAGEPENETKTATPLNSKMIGQPWETFASRHYSLHACLYPRAPVHFCWATLIGGKISLPMILLT